MKKERLAPLAPIWMERNAPRKAEVAQIVGYSFPSWEQMSREAEALNAKISSGHLPWPPPKLDFLHHVSRSQFGDPKTVAPEFRLLNTFQAEFLPSVRAYLDSVTEFFVTEMRGAISDPVRQIRMPLLFSSFTQRAWEHYGKQVYVIDPVTYELLVNTDLPAMPSEVLRAPLPAFYLQFPPRAFYFVDPDTNHRQEAEGAIVLFEQTMGDDGFGRSATVLVTGRGAPGQRDSFLWSYVFFSPKTPINEIKLRGLETIIRGEGLKEVSHDVPHAIFAFCLYLMSEHPSLTPVPPARKDLSTIRSLTKRRKAEKRNQKISSLGYIYVGGNEQSSIPAPEERGPAGGRRLTRPSWVRGHWRNQPYGPKRSLTKLIWIKPHLRGPDFSESVGVRAQKVQSAKPR